MSPRIRHHYHRNWENSALILLQFRNGHATDLPTLCQALGLRPGANPAEYYLENIVRKFIEAGLLQADDPEDLGHAKIGVTEQLSRFQAALDISLTFLASFNRSRSMAVEPLFGLPNKLEQLDVFVLMPFKDDMLPVYEDHIKPTCANMELSVRRADDFFTAGSVVQDVWAAIASARVIVADCTDRNPNVFYEIGLAHAIGQPTILLTQRAEDVPFDLRHLRYISYQLTPRGMKDFEMAFRETIRNALEKD
jgi:hypothetical protein